MTVLVGVGSGWTLTSTGPLTATNGMAAGNNSGYTASASGTATTAYIWTAGTGDGSPPFHKVVVYDSSNNRIAISSPIAAVTAGWASATINVAITSGQTYKLIVVGESGYYLRLGTSGAAGVVSTYTEASFPYSSPPATLPATSGTAVEFAVYLDGTTEVAKSSATTEVPKVTIGGVTDVDLDTTFGVVPKATLASIISRDVSASLSVVPKATMGAGQIFSSSLTRAQSQSLIPKATLANRLAKTIPRAQSLVPVATMANSVDIGNIGKTSTFSQVPVVTLASAVNNLYQSKSSALSLIPAVTLADQVNRINGRLDYQSQPTLTPRVTLTAVREVSGEVDRIDITSRPMGRISLRAV